MFEKVTVRHREQLHARLATQVERGLGLAVHEFGAELDRHRAVAVGSGQHPSTDAIVRLQNQHRFACFCQGAGGAQTSHARANHSYIPMLGHVHQCAESNSRVQGPNRRESAASLASATAPATRVEMSTQIDLFGRREPVFDSTFGEAKLVSSATRLPGSAGLLRTPHLKW